MSKQRILLHLDTDPQPSSFDAIVAIDSGVEHLLSYGNVTTDKVESLVHGAMFTRGPKDLKSTAIFLGGSDVERTAVIAERVKSTFFPGVQVSVMVDPNGSNTTAVAAVLSAMKHGDLSGKRVLVLGGTGPVGIRIAQLTASEGAQVRLASRRAERAEEACRLVASELESENKAGDLKAVGVEGPVQAVQAAQDADILFAAGAAGVRFLNAGWENETELSVAVDVNAVPPSGLEGVEVMDRGEMRNGTACYGAIGVGGLKMKLHKKCLQQLFEANDRVLETSEIFAIGKDLAKS